MAQGVKNARATAQRGSCVSEADETGSRDYADILKIGNGTSVEIRYDVQYRERDATYIHIAERDTLEIEYQNDTQQKPHPRENVDFRRQNRKTAAVT